MRDAARACAAVILAVALWATLTAPGHSKASARSIAGYRVVYSVRDSTGSTPSFRTEVVEVHRPFDGRVEVRETGRIQTGRITNREDFWQLDTGGGLQFGVRRTPGGPARDASWLALQDAARAGAVEMEGTGRILRRSCTWFAYSDKVVPMRRPTRTDRIESCVDREGIVLQEIWTISRRLAQVSTAVSLSAIVPDDSRFLEGIDPSTVDVSKPEAAQVFRTGTITSDEGIVVGVPISLHAPDGWQLERRAVTAQSTGQGAVPSQVLAMAFVRGNDLVVVERGTSKSLRPVWSPQDGTVVRIGPTGKGRIVYFIDRVEVRVVGDLGFARVIAPSRVIALQFARGLLEANA